MSKKMPASKQSKPTKKVIAKTKKPSVKRTIVFKEKYPVNNKELQDRVSLAAIDLRQPDAKIIK